MKLTTSSIPKKLEKKILTAIEMKKKLAEYEKEIKTELFFAMRENNIRQIKNDSYTISVTTRTNFTSDDITLVDPQYTKAVLDNNKCSQHYGLYGAAPEGVEVSETEYLMWRSK